MPSVSLSIPHGLTQEEATSRLKRYLERVKEKHADKVSNLEDEWLDNVLKCSFSTFGFNVKADMAVEPDKVAVTATVPFAAMMFKGKIEQGVRDELTRVLG